MTQSKTSTSLLLLGAEGGLAVIPESTPLTRLNYFDGKFLRAADLEVEQKYLRTMIALSNQGLGSGVVYGFDVSLGNGGTLLIGPGLAMDGAGRALLLPQATTVSLSELFSAASPASPPSGPASASLESAFQPCAVPQASGPAAVSTSQLWIISVGFAEALCGQEDVYGRLCELACVTSSERPYRLEGLVVRARALTLGTSLPTSSAVAVDDPKFLRSRVAHAYFEDERSQRPDAIDNGLRSEVWCHGAELGAAYPDVPLALVARDGSSIRFLDAWTVRRERIESPSRRHWQWKTMMRPWDVFLAQVLQFQCQLRDGLSALENIPSSAGSAVLRGEAAHAISELRSFYADVAKRLADNPTHAKSAAMSAPPIDLHEAYAKLDALAGKFADATTGLDAYPIRDVLIEAGLVELSPAGYLPVEPNSGSINEQVRNLVGDGLDLRFCVARPDYIAGAFQEAQHLERISLLDGIGHDDKPEVDIFVPDGRIISSDAATSGVGFKLDVTVPLSIPDPAPGGEINDTGNRITPQTLSLRGAARYARSATGEHKLYAAAGYVAGDSTVASARVKRRKAAAKADTASSRTSERDWWSSIAVWLELTLDRNPLDSSNPTSVSVQANAYFLWDSETFFHLDAYGDLTNIARKSKPITTADLDAHALVSGLATTVWPPPSPPPAPIPITWTPETDGATLSVALGDPREGSGVVALKLEWERFPVVGLSLSQKVNDDDEDSDVALGSATAEQAPDVFRRDEAHHVIATSALELIASVVDPVEHGRFGKTQPRRLLFPNDPSNSGAVYVQGIHDWVLFRRRRETKCALEHVVVVEARELYRIYVAPSFDVDPQKLPKEAKEIALASFDAGTAELLTSSSDLAAAWSSTPLEGIVHGMLVASVLDDELLQRARARRVFSALESSPPGPVPTPVTVRKLATAGSSLAGVRGLIVIGVGRSRRVR